MATHPSSDWFVKTETAVLGPFPAQDLLQQASLGELTGDSEISANRNGPWLKADTLEALELDWQVQPEEGDPLPRCHALALRTWVEGGMIQPYWDILHVPSGEKYDVVDALCSALLEQNRVLEEKLSGNSHPSEEQADTPELADAPSKKEAAKWKRLYEDEVERNSEREDHLRQDNNDLRAWQRKAVERIRALERQQASLADIRESLNSADHSAEEQDLAVAYRDLQIQQSHLLESLQLKTGQLDDIREQVRDLKTQLHQERRKAEEEVEQASRMHEEALDRLNSLEEAHALLTKSYRDLNDRFITLRNRHPSRPTETTPPTSEKPGKPAPARPAPPPQPKKKDGAVKLKMT